MVRFACGTGPTRLGVTTFAFTEAEGGIAKAATDAMFLRFPTQCGSAIVRDEAGDTVISGIQPGSTGEYEIPASDMNGDGYLVYSFEPEDNLGEFRIRLQIECNQQLIAVDSAVCTVIEVNIRETEEAGGYDPLNPGGEWPVLSVPDNGSNSAIEAIVYPEYVEMPYDSISELEAEGEQVSVATGCASSSPPTARTAR